MVRLFYFGLKIYKNLNKHDYFAIIGNERFRIPKSLINMPGNNPNFSQSILIVY